MQPQPLRSACAPEPTPCLIIQDMSTAFHRRHGRQEPGQGRGAAPSLGQGSPGPAWNLIGRPPNSCYTLVTRGVPTWPHSQATREEVCTQESLAYSATFLDHTPEGSDNSIPHLLASLTPNSSTQPPPDLSTPLTAPSRELLRKATCLNEGGEGRAENGTGQARQTRGP